MEDAAQYLQQYQDNIAGMDQDQTGPGSGPGKPKRPNRAAPSKGQPVAVSGGDGGFDAASLLAPVNTAGLPVTQPAPMSGGSAGITDLNAYLPYMESGVHTERGDIDEMRAINQGFWEGTGKHLGNFVPNVAAGIIENAGYLGALVTEFGDDRDYSNAITDLAKTMKNPFGEVYREHPNQIWDIKDPAWWGDNFWQLAESATQFGISGAGIGSMFGNMARAAARVGKIAGKIGQVTGQVATAGTLAYMEGAQFGAEVFNRTYQVRLQDLLASGINPIEAQEKAKGDASNAAATAVQLNTALATGLNMTGVAAMFKSDDDIMRWFQRSQAMRRGAGEDLGGWVSRLRGAASENPDLARMLAMGTTMTQAKHLGIEALQEGTEEVINQFAERTGNAQGAEGRRSSFFGQFKELSHFFDRTMDSEGALNFVLGAIGGVAQTVALDHIPIHRVPVMDSNGSPVEVNGKAQTQIVSSHQRNAMGAQRYYANIVDAIEGDVNMYQAQTTRLNAAIAAGNQEEARLIRDNIFDTRLYNSIMLGQGEAWIAEMDRIGSLDNTTTLTDELTPQFQELVAQRQEAEAKGADQATLDQMDAQIRSLNDQMHNDGESTEATRMGYANDIGDNAYKDKAEQAKKDIAHLQEEWNRVNAKYNSPEEQALNFPAFIFGKRADLYRRDNILRDAERDINTRAAELQQTPGVAQTPDVLFLNQLVTLQALMGAREVLNAKTKELHKAIQDGNITDMDRLVRELGGATESRDLVKAAEETINSTVDKINEMDGKGAEMERILGTSESFQDYKKNGNGKGKSAGLQLSGYIEEQAAKISQQANVEALNEHRKNYEQFKAETELHRKALDFYETRKGRQQYLKQARAAQTATAREKYEQQRADALARVRENADDQAAAETEYMRGRSQEGIRRLQLYNLRKQLAEMLQDKSNILDRIHELLVTPLGNSIADFFGGRARRLVQIRRERRNLAELEQRIRQVEVDIQHYVDLGNQAANAASQAASNPGQQTAPPPPAPPANPSPTPAPNPAPAPAPGTVAEAEAANQAENADDWAALGIDVDEEVPVTPPATPEEPAAAPVEEAPAAAEPTSSETAVDEAVDVDRQLYNILDTLPDAIRRKVRGKINDAMFQVITKSVPEISGDLFADEVRNGELTPIQAGQLIQLTRDSVRKFLGLQEEVNATQEEAVANEEAAEEIAEVQEEQQELEPFPQDPESDQEGYTDKIQSLPENYSPLDDSVSHMGAQATDINKVNNTGLEYDERKDSDGNYQIISVTASIREGYPTSLLRPGAIQIDDELVLEVDENYDGTINVDTQMNEEDRGAMQRASSFADFVTNGKVTDVGNIPIKITLAKTGEVIGYVPREGWLNARYPGAENYRNIADTITYPDGSVGDNIALQNQRLLQIRQDVVGNYENGKQPSRTKVSNAGPGQLIYATKTVNNRAKTVDGSTKNRLPDKTLRFGIAAGGRVYTGKNPLGRRVEAGVYWNQLPNPNWTNLPGVIVPTYNGSYTFSPIRMRGHTQADINTVSRGIELFLLNRSNPNDPVVIAEAEKILNATGMDVRSPQGLRQFVNQYYTYTEGFSKAKTLADVNAMRQAGVTSPYFMMDIRDNGDIKVGWAFSGRKTVYALLEGNRLTSYFQETLAEGLQTRTRNVTYGNPNKGLRGVNETGEFKEVQYNKAGKWVQTSHESYNDYLKSISYTPLVGTNQVGSRYVYTVNPQILFNHEALQTSPADTQVVEERPEIEGTTAPAYDPATAGAEIEDQIAAPEETAQSQLDEPLTDIEQMDLDNIFGNMSRMAPPVNEVGSDPAAAPLSLEALAEMYNFTPIEQQNGKSPQQVFEELTRQGIGQLAPGFNPFKNCS